MDGSAAPFVYLVNEAGVKRLQAPRRYLKVLRPISLTQGDKRIAFVASGFEQYVSLMPELSVVPEADSHKQRLQNVDRR